MGNASLKSGRAGVAFLTLALAAWTPAVLNAAVIEQIRIDNAQRIERQTVLSYLSLGVGDEASPERLDQSLKALFASGLFNDVALAMDNDTLVVTVTENPIVNRLVFEGNDHLKTEDLEKEVQMKARGVLTRARVQSDVQRLLDLYQRNGRFGAVVTPKVVKLEQNRVDLVYEIKEGSRTGVQRIAFVGNKAFSDSELRSQMATRETRWWRFLSATDFYDPDRTGFDKELLRRFYLGEGYADFRVASATAELTQDREDFLVTFTMEEGERYRFGPVKLESQIKGLDGESLREFVTVRQGDWYDSRQVEDSIAKLSAAVGDRQYAFVRVEPRMDRNRETREITMTFVLNEGPKVYVERIDVAGNMRTMDKVVRREMLLAEGDPFNLSLLKRSEQRVKDLGFFETVNVTPAEGSQPDRTVLKTEIKEKSTGELSIGAGYSTADGILGDFSIRERNFLGRGQDARLGVTASGRTQSYDASFTEPYFLERDLAAGVDLFRVNRDNQDRSSYDEASTGFGLRLGYPITESLRQKLSYTFSSDEINNVPSDASRFVREQEGTTISSILGQELSWDKRDSKLKPTDGYVVRLSTDVAGAGGDVQYLRSKLTGSWYYPIAPQWVFSLLGEGGWMDGLGQRTRINDHFFLGGDNLRGFAFAGVGPRDLTAGADDSLGGTRYVRSSAELELPIGLPEELGFKGHVFTDMGTLGGADVKALPSETFMATEALRASVGFGVSWQSPLGPIRVDWAEPFQRESYDKVERFRFSFGTRL